MGVLTKPCKGIYLPGLVSQYKSILPYILNKVLMYRHDGVKPMNGQVFSNLHRIKQAMFILLVITGVGCASSGTTPRPRAPETKKMVSNVTSEILPTPDEELITRVERQFQAALQSYRNGDLEEARRGFDSVTETLITILPTSPLFERAQSLLMDVMENSLELDRIAESQLAEEETEPAFIDSIGATRVLLSEKEIANWAEKINQYRDHMRFEIPIVVKPSVIEMIRAYQTVRRAEFTRGLARMPRYLPLYLKMFQDAGLPRELAYLPLIESGYNPRAYSRARARGVWQFIYGTGRKYGLNVNWWLDERSDFVRSTEAAILYLKDLYMIFNDWWLALAAYNAGEGRIQRAITQAGTRDFWELQARGVLPYETTKYVPAFMAAVLIATNPELFGYERPEAEPITWEEVEVRGGISLSSIARASGLDHEELKAYNDALRRAYIPAGTTYRLRIPMAQASQVLAVLYRLPRNSHDGYITHRVRSGDTLSSIARRYHVSLNSLLEVNHMRLGSIIHPGQVLTIPITAEKPYVAQRNTPASGQHIVVRPGDTLYTIAQSRGLDWRTLLKWNPNLIPQKLKPGQTLTIPAYIPVSSNNSGQTYHIVRPGDTLYLIAREYGISLNRLLEYNQLSKTSVLYPGHRILIPPKEAYNANQNTAGR